MTKRLKNYAFIVGKEVVVRLHSIDEKKAKKIEKLFKAVKDSDLTGYEIGILKQLIDYEQGTRAI